MLPTFTVFQIETLQRVLYTFFVTREWAFFAFRET